MICKCSYEEENDHIKEFKEFLQEVRQCQCKVVQLAHEQITKLRSFQVNFVKNVEKPIF